jgi:hypothetical protein
MYKIAISGKVKSGKNTVASIILEELSRVQNKIIINKVIAFADPIKEIILKMFPGAKRDYLFGPSELRSEIIDNNLFDSCGNPLTYRQALIDIGDLARKYNSSAWVNCFKKEYDLILDQNSEILKKEKINAIIVPDLRFSEEFSFLKNNKFFLIKINRDNVTRINHASETNQEKFKNSDFNFILDNNSSVFDLKNNIRDNLIPLLAKSYN